MGLPMYHAETPTNLSTRDSLILLLILNILEMRFLITFSIIFPGAMLLFQDQLVKRAVFIKLVIMSLGSQNMAKLMGEDVTLNAPVINILDREDDDAAKSIWLAEAVLLCHKS